MLRPGVVPPTYEGALRGQDRILRQLSELEGAVANVRSGSVKAHLTARCLLCKKALGDSCILTGRMGNSVRSAFRGQHQCRSSPRRWPWEEVGEKSAASCRLEFCQVRLRLRRTTATSELPPFLARPPTANWKELRRAQPLGPVWTLRRKALESQSHSSCSGPGVWGFSVHD